MAKRPWNSPDGIEFSMRPMSPTDIGIARDVSQKLSARTRYLRFFLSSWRVSEERLAKAVNPDPAREYALIVTTGAGESESAAGAGRFFVTALGDDAEFALLVADEWQRRGIGERLLKALIDEARRRGLKRLHGEILATNRGMLALARRLGFAVAPHPDDHGIRIATLDLGTSAPAAT